MPVLRRGIDGPQESHHSTALHGAGGWGRVECLKHEQTHATLEQSTIGPPGADATDPLCRLPLDPG